MKKRNIISAVVGAVLVVILVLLLFAFQVRYGQVAVVTTFGKPVRNINGLTDAGLYFKLPWPIQRVYKFDGRTQNFQDKFQESLTHDNNSLILTIFAGWKISDASEFYPKFLGSVTYAQTQLEGMLRNAQTAVVSTNNMSAFVNADPSQLRFDQMETEI